MKLIYFFILLFLPNCGNAQISLGTKIAKGQINRITKYNAFYTYFEKDDQKLFFVPMIHVNKPEFYEKRKSTIDSLRNEGYIFFYEGIQLELESKEETELYAKKFRKITHETLLNYYDETNEEDRSYKIEGYVFQNDVDYGLDLDKDINCDLSTKDLVQLYEEKFGKVILTDCDWGTPIGKKYKCSKKDKKGYDYMISTLRNEHLFNEIKNSKAKKIAVVYGMVHTNVVALMLKHAEWKYVRL
ncbi:hypothetical protein NU10_10640 [Flavobacterium dauae]|uniref:hypothetical protein n=1 Tax=Flavobacterium dauae TaxID=1563479 RepID=UPI00101C1E64|nr:hypothetical protein [Flavobacterium dauae]WLD23161.1 hypothetical protein NU10_10640 [Flavobacterium dauae]